MNIQPDFLNPYHHFAKRQVSPMKKNGLLAAIRAFSGPCLSIKWVLGLLLAGFFCGPAVAQVPETLRFKWVGELEITPSAGTPTSAHIELGIGNWEAKTPDEVEFMLNNFSDSKGYYFKYLGAQFDAANGVPTVSVAAPYPMPGVSCPGTYHFTLLTREGASFLYGAFQPADATCGSHTVRAVLLPKQVARDHMKAGDYQSLLADLTRYAATIPGGTPPAKATASSTLASTPRQTDRQPEPTAVASSNPATEGVGVGYTVRLAATPVVLEVDKLYNFNDGYAVVARGSSQALIDRSGKYVIPFNKYIFSSNGSYPTRFPDPSYVVGMPWDDYGFIRGFCTVQDVHTGKWGMLDTRLQLVVPCQYLEIGYFNAQGFVETGLPTGGSRITLDRHGNVVPTTKREFVTSTGGGYAMPSGRPDGLNHEAGHYPSYGLYVVYGQPDYRTSERSMLAGFADRLGNLKIPARYVNAKPFFDGLAAVSKHNEFGEEKWGFINTRGEQVIDFKFSKQPGNFHNGLALVEPLQQEEYRYVYINKKGEPVIFLRHDADCSYFPAAMRSDLFSGATNAYKWASTFHDGYALWSKNCRSSSRDQAEGGTLVMDTLGNTFVLQQRLARNGWSGGTTPRTDFINNEAVVTSGLGVVKDETEAIITIRGDIIIKTPRGRGQWGEIYSLFDPVSQLAKALVSQNDEATDGYVNREGVMTIVRGKGSKW